MKAPRTQRGSGRGLCLRLRCSAALPPGRRTAVRSGSSATAATRTMARHGRARLTSAPATSTLVNAASKWAQLHYSFALHSATMRCPRSQIFAKSDKLRVCILGKTRRGPLTNFLELFCSLSFQGMAEVRQLELWQRQADLAALREEGVHGWVD